MTVKFFLTGEADTSPGIGVHKEINTPAIKVRYKRPENIFMRREVKEDEVKAIMKRSNVRARLSEKAIEKLKERQRKGREEHERLKANRGQGQDNG